MLLFLLCCCLTEENLCEIEEQKRQSVSFVLFSLDIIMFRWLRDTFNSIPFSSTDHLPASFVHQQKREEESSSSDEENETNHSNDLWLYHNPSGQINYINVPQQQYVNEHTYPTYLARQQTSDEINPMVNDQIHAKFLLLRQHSLPKHKNNILRNQSIPTVISNQQSDESERSSYMEESNHLSTSYYFNTDKQIDFVSVVYWYKNVMKSIKKLLWVKINRSRKR